MEIYLGKRGLLNSWQDPFKATEKCYKCGAKAKIMFVASEGFEKEEKEYLCDMHRTTGKEGGLWLHDACAVAVYLCPKCFEATAIVNQA
jgi:hypothetical protein